MIMSIRKDLLKWQLAAILGACLVAAGATYLVVVSQVDQLVDDELKQTAYSSAVASRLITSFVADSDDSDAEDNDFIAEIWDANGGLQYASDPVLRLPASVPIGLSDQRLGGDTWRVFKVRRQGRIIETAIPIESRAETATQMALPLLIPIAALVPLLAFLSVLVVRRGLQPLRAIATEIGDRGVERMSSIDPTSVPDEIRVLVGSLNMLLGRLDEAMTAQRRFVADAAHELRTPLTALLLQAQLGCRSDDDTERQHALNSIHHGVERATHLVTQLLTLARQEPDAPVKHIKVDMAELARQVVSDHTPMALAKSIDLGVDANVTAPVLGDREALRVAVENLVDNAVRYTPSEGVVDVAVRTNGNVVEVSVRDTGPGVPASESERIFDRFYREPGQSVPGSGLGLSIVRQVARRHGGTATVSRADSRGGAVFTFSVPRAQEFGVGDALPRNETAPHAHN